MGFLDYFRRAKPTKEASILMLGCDDAGKSMLVQKLCGEEATHIMPTQGFNIKSIATEGFKINVCDVGGSRAARAYWRFAFDKTDVIVYVVDAADTRRLEESAGELEHLLDEPKLAGVPLLVFANKQDLDGAATPATIAELMHLAALRDRAWNIAACSAKTGVGVQEGLEWVTRTLSSVK